MRHDIAGTPSAHWHACDTAPPFPPAFWDVTRCRPCLVCAVCALLFLFFFFFLSISSFFCSPVAALLLLQVHRDPLPRANMRGSKAVTLWLPTSPKPHLRCHCHCIPLPRHHLRCRVVPSTQHPFFHHGQGCMALRATHHTLLMSSCLGGAGLTGVGAYGVWMLGPAT